MKSLKVVFVFLVLAAANNVSALNPDSIFVNNIKTVRLYTMGNQLTIPVIHLKGNDQLQLQFDDLDADVKYYYYTYQLCNSDWTPANIGPFEYLKGFTQQRITNYRFSSIAHIRYTHYEVILPEQTMFPTRSGNYILKVYLNNDTSQIAFTKRIMVMDNKASIMARVTKPYSPEFSNTHQKVDFTVDVKALQSFNAPQQIKVVLLQNYRWDDAIENLKPAFIRGTSLEYNTANTAIFGGGKEWRWLDVRDFHLQSDRVLTADYKKNSTDIFLRSDIPLSTQRYIYYRDLNGMSSIEAIRGINPFYEGDYATVYFSFAPSNGQPYTDKNIYLFGQLTNYNYVDSLQMKFNPEKSVYETHQLLKQGYYDYTYIAVDKNNPSVRTELDGNYFETENVYTILVYYKPFIGRADELIGVYSLDSRTDQPGLNF
ncbi:MAG: DUF5103 domain-containing protein [Ginsengibacter sp.]